MAFTRDFDKEYADAMAAANAQGWATGQTDYSVVQKIVADRDAEAARIAAANSAWNAANSGSRSTYTPPPPPPTPPDPWVRTSDYAAPTGVKQADPDIILDSAIDTSGDYIVERFFEELGGTELINISRHDLIDGIDVVYNPIANLSSLRTRFNPNNIIAIDYLSENEFTRTSIDLISRGMNEPYFDNDGNLIIEIDIMRREENIEAEISESGTVNRIEL